MRLTAARLAEDIFSSTYEMYDPPYESGDRVDVSIDPEGGTTLYFVVHSFDGERFDPPIRLRVAVEEAS